MTKFNQDADSLFTPEDLNAIANEAGGEPGGEGGESGSHPALEKFGGDAEKLAEGYENLERKLGEQGERLGRVSEELRVLTEALAKKANGEPSQKEFIDGLRKKVSDGEMDVLDAFEQLSTGFEERMGKQLEGVRGEVRESANERVWNQFIAENKDAKAFESVMTRIVKRNPALLVANTPQRLKESLQDILTLAKAKYQELRESGGGTRLDRGTSRRVGRGGTKPGDDPKLKELIDAARQSDEAVDWAKVVEEKYFPD